MTATTHTAECKRCGRLLRDPKSVARGMGPTCARKRRQETAARIILENYSAVQVEKVRELLEDGGVARTSRHTFTVVASNGTDRYTVDTTQASCTCKAAQHGRRCYHVAAATLAAA